MAHSPEYIRKAAALAQRIERMAADQVEGFDRGLRLTGFSGDQRAIFLRAVARKALTVAAEAEDAP